MTLKLIAAPEVEPVTLAEAKAQLRITTSDSDDMITALIQAARQQLDGNDGWLRRALVTQTWELTLDAFPCREIRIPLPPLQSITSINYDDRDGLEQTVSASAYDVDAVGQPGWVVPVRGSPWPVAMSAINAVRIRFVAGYPPSTDSPPDLRLNVPRPIKQAILLMVKNLWGLGERNLFISSEDVIGVGSRSFVVSENAARVMNAAAENLLSTYRVFE